MSSKQAIPEMNTEEEQLRLEQRAARMKRRKHHLGTHSVE